MSTFFSYLAAVVLAFAVVYFIYTRVRKAKDRRDILERGIGGRSTGAGGRGRGGVGDGV